MSDKDYKSPGNLVFPDPLKAAADRKRTLEEEPWQLRRRFATPLSELPLAEAKKDVSKAEPKLEPELVGAPQERKEVRAAVWLNAHTQRIFTPVNPNPDPILCFHHADAREVTARLAVLGVQEASGATTEGYYVTPGSNPTVWVTGRDSLRTLATKGVDFAGKEELATKWEKLRRASWLEKNVMRKATMSIGPGWRD